MLHVMLQHLASSGTAYISRFITAIVIYRCSNCVQYEMLCFAHSHDGVMGKSGVGVSVTVVNVW